MGTIGIAPAYAKGGQSGRGQSGSSTHARPATLPHSNVAGTRHSAPPCRSESPRASCSRPIDDRRAGGLGLACSGHCSTTAPLDTAQTGTDVPSDPYVIVTSSTRRTVRRAARHRLHRRIAAMRAAMRSPMATTAEVALVAQRLPDVPTGHHGLRDGMPRTFERSRIDRARWTAAHGRRDLSRRRCRTNLHERIPAITGMGAMRLFFRPSVSVRRPLARAVSCVA